ncbi:hypothetical protein MVEN_00751100 [Mycena venus]|uniref:Uncharacterized protein n=1 Tax=Mycena venus TaxID=2733690 RepID=A0A8H7D643_9AGAR|nr:hypothetical protein MVEN_00751100 [Mycena venus]
MRAYSKLESENCRLYRTTVGARTKRCCSCEALYTLIPSQNTPLNLLLLHQYYFRLRSTHRPNTTSYSLSRRARRPGRPLSGQNCTWTPDGMLPPRPAYLQENHSAGDLTGWRASRTSPSTPSSSRKDSLQSTSASSQEKLLPYCSSPDHDSESEDLADPPYRPSASSIPYVTVTKPSSSSSRNNEAKLSCRFLSAVRLPLPRPKSKLSCLVQTKRAVNANSSIIDNIRAKPFIHSDPCNPLHGITVTVQRQRLVSEPMIMPLPELFARMPIPGASSSSSSPSASATSLLSVTSGSASRVSLGDLKLDKPLPTPTPSEEEDLHPTITPVEDPHPHPYLPTGDDLDSGEVPISIVVPAPGDEPTVVQDAAEADGDPFADVPADALSPTAADLNQDPYPDPDPDPDLDLEPELVEFKSQLSVTVTPATATRLHVLPARHPKRRKRYTNSVRLGTADASMRVSAVGGPSSLSDLG